MADNAQGENQRIKQLEALLIEAGKKRRPPVVAETFLRSWKTASKPVALNCDDGRDYVVKGSNAGRMIVNDHIIAHIGMSLGAPVGYPQIIEISADLQGIEPQMAHITLGTAHGTRLIKNCSERANISNTNVPGNRDRFALLAVLFGWCYAVDAQFIYENSSTPLVYSVDHGHFFPSKGPNWKIADLTSAPPATLDQIILNASNFSSLEISKALFSLKSVTEGEIILCVASPPDEWNITMEDRVALVDFLTRRQDELIRSMAAY